MMYYFKLSNQLCMLATTHPDQASLVDPPSTSLERGSKTAFCKEFLIPSMREAERGGDKRSDVGVSRLCVKKAKRLNS